MRQTPAVRWMFGLAATLMTMMTMLRAGAAGTGLPAYRYEALAFLGARAPGGGALRGAIRPGAVGSGGEVAYTAGVGSQGAEGLFLDTVDGVFTIATPDAEAVEGWQFAAKPGILSGIAAPVSMDAAGDLAFAADITRDGQDGSGVFRWERDSQTLAALALPGQPAPGGSIFGNTHSAASIAAAGEVAFAAMLSAPGAAGEALFHWSSGQSAVVLRPGDPEPGGGQFVDASHPNLNRSGRVAFQGEVRRAGQSSTGVFFWDGARITAVADAGTPAPGGGTFREARGPRLNDHGDIAFLGSTGEWAVYLSRDGRMARLAGPGTALTRGARVSAALADPGSLALNQQGEVAMALALEKPAATGVFLCREGALWPVALPGTFLAGIGPLDNVGASVALSDNGQVAFQAELADGQVALVLATPVPSGG